MNKTKEMLNILINIRYRYSMNKFEETYGENVQYSRLEQESYIELKDMMTLKMNRKIKFRKFERNGMVLTLRAELTEKEYKKALDLKDENFFIFFSNFVVSEIKILQNIE